MNPPENKDCGCSNTQPPNPPKDQFGSNKPFPMDNAPKFSSCCLGESVDLSSFASESPDRAPCCGAPPPAKSHPYEKPGYQLHGFVEGFVKTAAGEVPRISSRLGRWDLAGSMAARFGLNRNNHKIAPGLYCIGKTNPDSPVLVSANYKLSFDTLRKALDGVAVWILVLDTRGINVWCAAGEALFSTQEVAERVKKSGLASIVNHRKLICPQLSATGVSARGVKERCGFKVIWGPIRANDISRFLADGMTTDARMRRVTFSTWERTILVPVEITLLAKPAAWVMLAAFLLSGIGPGIFSISGAWSRGWMLNTALIIAIFAGAAVAPILLPWIPGRSFSIKGVITGIPAGLLSALIFWEQAGFWGSLAFLILIGAVSSYLSMNFTGSTPFTSPSGVEKEMRKAIPFQLGAVVLGVLTWIGAAFAG